MKIIPLNTDVDGCASCIKANYYKMGGANFIGHTNDGFKATCVMEIDETTTMSENDINRDEPLRIPQATEQGYVEVPVGGVFDGSYPNSKTRRGRVQEGGTVAPTLMAGGEGLNLYEGIEPVTEDPKIIQKCGDRGTSKYSESPISYTIPANPMSDRGQLLVEPQYRIRKLTPRECFRLMGVSESDIDKIQQSGISNSQQYKMAGNSIVVDVLYYIFKNMISEEDDNSKADEHGQLSLF